MTAPPAAEPLVCRDLGEAVDALRRRGLRLSTARRLVLEALFAADGPLGAEEIASRLRLDLPSVYRNLETLGRHGFVRHVHLGHGPGLYALRARGEEEYLACERCGRVTALPADALDPVRDELRRRFGFEARFAHHAIVGLCRDCAAGD